MELILATAEGALNIVKLLKDRVRIQKKSVFGSIKNEVDILLKDLSGVEFRKASFYANGYIRFFTKEKTHTVTVIGKHNQIFDEMRKKIEKRKTYVIEMSDSNISNSDELDILIALCDEGVVTKGELEIKRMQFLDGLKK